MKNTGRRPKIMVSDDGRGIVSQAGALLLTDTERIRGLGAGLSAGLARWRPGRAVHDPTAIREARATARQRAWMLAGDAAPAADDGQVVVDIDATIVTACSEKEQARPTRYCLAKPRDYRG